MDFHRRKTRRGQLIIQHFNLFSAKLAFLHIFHFTLDLWNYKKLTPFISNCLISVCSIFASLHSPCNLQIWTLENHDGSRTCENYYYELFAV